jgi:hypothetical protein
MSEAMVDGFKLIDDSEMPGSASSMLKALKKNGFKVKIDPKTLVGIASLEGTKIPISLGSENLNLEFPDMFIKGGWDETLPLMAKFIKEVNNWGGSN